jgi:hypothetical protein
MPQAIALEPVSYFPGGNLVLPQGSWLDQDGSGYRGAGVLQGFNAFYYADVGRDPGVDLRCMVVAPLLSALGNTVVLQAQPVAEESIVYRFRSRGSAPQARYAGDALQRIRKLGGGFPVKFPRVAGAGFGRDRYCFGVVVVVVQVDRDLGVSLEVKGPGFAVAADVGEAEGLRSGAKVGEAEVTSAVGLDTAAGGFAIDGGVGQGFFVVLGEELAG